MRRSKRRLRLQEDQLHTQSRVRKKQSVVEIFPGTSLQGIVGFTEF
jgi:hypothetical protein